MSDTAEAGEALPRYDVLIVSENRSFNIVEQGTRALVNHLIAKNIARVSAESIAKDWCEIYGGPGPTAHEAFTLGGFDSDHAPFLEVAVRTGTKFTTMPFGGAKNEGVRFWIEFRGVLWKDLAPRFRNGLTRLLATRLEVLTRPHAGLAAHAEVAADEVPEDVKFARKDRATPRVGTAVEEY